jgi:hypothetical protein
LTEEVKSLWEYSRGMKMFMEVIDSWMSIESYNWNREGELDCHKEDEESQTAREVEESQYNIQ